MSKSAKRIAYVAVGIVIILVIIAVALPNAKSTSIPAGQTFVEFVENIAASEQNSIEWIACPDEVKQSPLQAGEISAADGQQLIESAGKRAQHAKQIKRVILDDKGRKYTIYCN